MTRRNLLGLLGWLSASASESRAGEALFHYRAKATILMLSVPLYTRESVGGAYLRVTERGSGAERRIDLAFAAGSLPERVAGMKRLGVFEESIVEQSGVLARASYFGFMTASNEKNLEQARAALKENEAAGNVTAIRGRIDGRWVWNRLARLSGLAAVGWEQHRSLSVEVRRLLETSHGEEREIEAAPAQCPHTFLYAVHRAMRASGPVEQNFVHNGELLTLRTEPSGAASEGGAAVPLTGRILHLSGKPLSSFQLWYDPHAAVLAPVRFEFRPRSFLRLSFERVPAA